MVKEKSVWWEVLEREQELHHFMTLQKNSVAAKSKGNKSILFRQRQRIRQSFIKDRITNNNLQSCKLELYKQLI
jgi:hypothetical protein